MEQSRTDVRNPLRARARIVRCSFDDAQDDEDPGCRQHNSEQANPMNLLATLAATAKARRQEKQRGSPER